MKKIFVITTSVIFLLSLTASIGAKKPMDTEVFYVPSDYVTIQGAVNAVDPDKLTKHSFLSCGDNLTKLKHISNRAHSHFIHRFHH